MTTATTTTKANDDTTSLLPMTTTEWEGIVQTEKHSRDHNMVSLSGSDSRLLVIADRVVATLCEREFCRSVLSFLLGPTMKGDYMLPEGMRCANCDGKVGKDHYCRDCGWGCNPATNDGWKF